MVPHTLLNIAQTSVQIDIFHTFHDIRINKGAVFPKPCDKLLHLLALGSMDNITTVHRFPGSRPFFCDLLRKPAGTLEEMKVVAVPPGQNILFLYKIQRPYELHT